MPNVKISQLPNVSGTIPNIKCKNFKEDNVKYQTFKKPNVNCQMWSIRALS